MTTPCPETSTRCAARWRAALTGLSPTQRLHVLTKLRGRDLELLLSDFDAFAHPYQLPPLVAANGEDWKTWLLIGGRGAGKTRAGAQWVRKLALSQPRSRIALVGETFADVRDVMIEGESGLLAIHAGSERPLWQPSRRRLEWKNGAIAQAFSAEDPESLRGPQFSAAWADELAKWRHAEATFDMLQFGLRLGERPRQVVTTTPRPLPLLKRLMADPANAVTRASTRDNAFNLAPGFLDTVLARYAGTRLGRQEIEGEIVEERPDALWSRALIESVRVAQAPPLARVVVAVDPPASAREGADACGLLAAGRAADGSVYVLADESAGGLSPAGWAARAIALWRRLEADALVVEVNQGGDMVRAVIAQADASVPVTVVRASRGKWLRAEPVAALYEQGRVKHAGVFPALEDEMCDFGLDGLSGGRSPDRLDALVWAVTALTFEAR
ncbi:MAG: terminase family protein, partial [Pseudorhodoplanes sp.]|nr:terminase family protein [Pseudorhodoplanes sp.]